jgi:RHS repeat-associated protein
MLAALAQPRHIKESHRRRRRGASRVWLPGQYLDSESGLAYNVNRDYEPATGRYMQSDPIGLEGGLSTYNYVGASPLLHTDPLGLVRALDPNSRECQDLARKIDNIKNDLEKRRQEYETNPNGLPENIFPGSRPRDTREGHLGLILEQEGTLAQRETEYLAKCGGPPPPPASCPATDPQAPPSPNVAPTPRVTPQQALILLLMGLGGSLLANPAT